MSQAEHSINYVKMWVILLILLAISIIGPMFDILILTLVTAFGIAVVKALMVASYFMHLNTEKKYIWWLLIGSLLFLIALFVGMAPDIYKDGGTNWRNCMVDNTCVEQRL